MKKQFYKYVFQNVAGMIGISIYILADTFFISVSAGADGITVLNLVLPLFGLQFALGSMIGIGSATRYAIKKAQGQEGIDFYFTHSLTWQILISIPFVLVGIFAPGNYLGFMGGDAGIIALGTDYVRIILLFTPFFMSNYTFTAFARNDNAPTIAMFACLAGSAFNIAFDYIFMFPMKLGLAGAALATAVSPIITMLVTCVHFASKKSSIKFQWVVPSVKHLFLCMQLGVSAFVGEMSSAITTAIFNILLLGIAGNIGVAAYGVVANLSLIAMAIFNGISQGVQPLLSTAYGQGNRKDLQQFLRMGLVASVVVEGVVLLLAWGMTDTLVSIFNSEGNMMLAEYAYDGLRLYFLGYVLAGINMMLVTYFSATDRARNASIASLLRGAVAVIICAVVMSMIWGMNGVWLSFLAAELVTFAVILAMWKMKSREKHEVKLDL